MPDLPSPSGSLVENTADTSAGDLYSPVQIAVSAMIGAPAAAGWFISRNERQLGRPQNARLWFWGSVVGLIVLVLLSLLLPPNFPRFALAAGYVAGFYAAAKQLYSVVLQKQRAVYGPTGSWWKVVWISFVFLLLSFALVVITVLLVPTTVTDRFIPADQLP